MRPYEGGSTALTPEAALALQRQMERDFTNQQGAAQPQPAEDPFVTLQQILAQQQGYSGPSGADMAAQEFGPQFQALQQAAANAQKQYQTGNTDIGNMFNGLSASQKAQEGEIRNQYDATGQRIGGAYNEAINSVSSTFNKNQNALTEMMQRLGIQQAAPTVLGESQNHLGDALGLLARSQASRTGFNAQQGQNEISYNQRNADTTALAGKNKQSDLLRLLQQTQSGLDMKRLDLTGAQTQAANQYNMAIQKQQQSAQQTAVDNWFKQQQLGLQFDARDDRRAGMELDMSKYQSQLQADDAAAQQRLQQQQLTNMTNQHDAYGLLAANAGQYYDDPNQAAGALDRITQAYSAISGQPASLGQFLGSLTEGVTDPIEARKLQALGTIWWNQINSKGAYLAG